MNTPAGQYRGCSTYTDFRELLDKEKDIDALYIMTPEHLHGTIALAAMNQGKHVIQHKTLANVLYEAQALPRHGEEDRPGHADVLLGRPRLDRDDARVDRGRRDRRRARGAQLVVASRLAAGDDGAAEGASRPCRKGLDWDLWLGPVPQRPYHPAYTHAVFRGWYDFGSGALGDMGNYSFFQIWKILKLGTPTTVEATASQYWAIIDNLWNKQVNHGRLPAGLHDPLRVPRP